MPARATGVRLGESVNQESPIPTRLPRAVAFRDRGACSTDPPFPDLAIVLLRNQLGTPTAAFADDAHPQRFGRVDLVGYGARLKGGAYLGERLHGPAFAVSPDCAGPPPPETPHSNRYGCRQPSNGLLEMVASASAPQGFGQRPEELASDSCQGDSGGGVFVELPSPIKLTPRTGGTPRDNPESPLYQLDGASLEAAGLAFLATRYALTGIVSRGVKGTHGCGKGSVHVRVNAPVRAWIAQVVARHASKPASEMEPSRR